VEYLVPLCLVAMLVGIVGIVIPVLPGLLLVWGSVLVWAIFADVGWGKWVVLGVCTAWAAGGIVVKYAWPGQRMRRAGIPSRTLLAGVALGIVGMFVVPVVGLLLGFVLGVWLAESARMGGMDKAWPSTKQALLGAGLSILVELGAAMLVVGTWLLGLLVT
jgi:uncharacterized protein YqgC (DUF456 family)